MAMDYDTAELRAKQALRAQIEAEKEVRRLKATIADYQDRLARTRLKAKSATQELSYYVGMKEGMENCGH